MRLDDDFEYISVSVSNYITMWIFIYFMYVHILVMFSCWYVCVCVFVICVCPLLLFFLFNTLCLVQTFICSTHAAYVASFWFHFKKRWRRWRRCNWSASRLREINFYIKLKHSYWPSNNKVYVCMWESLSNFTSIFWKFHHFSAVSIEITLFNSIAI